MTTLRSWHLWCRRGLAHTPSSTRDRRTQQPTHWWLASGPPGTACGAVPGKCPGSRTSSGGLSALCGSCCCEQGTNRRRAKTEGRGPSQRALPDLPKTANRLHETNSSGRLRFHSKALVTHTGNFTPERARRSDAEAGSRLLLLCTFLLSSQASRERSMTSNSFSLDPQGIQAWAPGLRELSHAVRGVSGKHFASGLAPLGLDAPRVRGGAEHTGAGCEGWAGLQPRGTRAGAASRNEALGPHLCPGVATSMKLLKRRTEMGPPSLNHDLNLTGQN